MHKLSISHSTSRARDTYGYPIVKVTDDSGRTFRAMGGGYDMFGTVLADWITSVYPDRVAELGKRRAYYVVGVPGKATQVHEDGQYGVYRDAGTGRSWIDGGVGESTVQRLAREELGLTIRNKTNSKGHTIGWTVEDNN